MPTPVKKTIPPPQPRRSRRAVDNSREFDTTALHADKHGRFVHRDYAAHFFRWGFARRFIGNSTDVLDVGCGVDCQLAKVLNFPQGGRPRRYVGVDYNKKPRSVPGDRWAEFLWEFDFTRRYAELGRFDIVVTFEVLEHMREADGRKFLVGLRSCVADGGVLLLSTPVFDGRAAANHLNEWTAHDLSAALVDSKFSVERRHGTFASASTIRKVMTEEERDLVDELSRYYSWEVLSCFMAPKYPDASRNNVWVCRPSD